MTPDQHRFLRGFADGKPHPVPDAACSPAKNLIRRNLIDRVGTGVYAITEYGRAALADSGEECDGSRFCKADVHIHGCFAASREEQA